MVECYTRRQNKIVLKMDDSKQIRCLDFWSDKPYENKKIISESTKDKGVL